MTGPKTNERPGTRAEARYIRMSATKARAVLDLIRGLDVAQADQVLQFCERDAAIPIRKCLASAIANAEHNDSQLADELYVSACYADEGPTLKRWRPRAQWPRHPHPEAHVPHRGDRQPHARAAAREATGARRGQAVEPCGASQSGSRPRPRRRERVARSRAAAAEAAEPHDHEHDHDEHDHTVDEST